MQTDTGQKEQHTFIPLLHLHTHPAHVHVRTHTRIQMLLSTPPLPLFVFFGPHTPSAPLFLSFTPRHLVSPGPLSFLPLSSSSCFHSTLWCSGSRSRPIHARRPAGRCLAGCQSQTVGQWVQRISSQSCFAVNYRRQEEGDNSRQGNGEALYFPLPLRVCVRVWLWVCVYIYWCVCGRDRVSELEHSQYSRGDILNPPTTLLQLTQTSPLTKPCNYLRLFLFTPKATFCFCTHPCIKTHTQCAWLPWFSECFIFFRD